MQAALVTVAEGALRVEAVGPHVLVSLAGRGLIAPLPLARLAPREREVLILLGAGLTYREAANALGLSWRTVGTYANSALEKLGVRTTAMAAMWALLAGQIEAEQIIQVWRDYMPHLMKEGAL
jgi:DNA-binding NarL/FixJ family response regulator